MSENRQDEPEVFRGHLEECLRHFGATLAECAPKGSRKVVQAKMPIADFCGVTVDTVTRWLYDTESSPVGEQFIRLMCYLDFVGYQVIEWGRIPKVQRGFAELIGFGLLTSDQATKLLGYASVSTLYKVLRGECGANEDKNQLMWDIWKERRQELEQKKEAGKKLLRPVAPSAVSRVSRSATASIMEGLLTLLESEPSQEELAELRSSADTIFRLLVRLDVLGRRLMEKGGVNVS